MVLHKQSTLNYLASILLQGCTKSQQGVPIPPCSSSIIQPASARLTERMSGRSKESEERGWGVT